MDAAIGRASGRRVSSIFRFIQNHPEDLDSVTKPYSVSSPIGSFGPTLIPEGSSVIGRFSPIAHRMRPLEGGLPQLVRPVKKRVEGTLVPR